MNIENEKIRNKIHKIEKDLEQNNDCKTYKQVLEKLNNNDLIVLYAEKFLIGNNFNYNRKSIIDELEAIHIKEFDVTFNF